MAFGPPSSAHVAQIQLGDLLARHLAAANLLGRLHVGRFAVKKTRRPVLLATAMGRARVFGEDNSQDDAESDPLNIGFSFDIPATGAIEYLRNLTPVTREVFDGLQQHYRNDAFTISGISDQRLIAKIRDALEKTLTKGGTAADFHKAVNELTTEAGIQKLAAFELDTVFQTNTGKAYSAGRLDGGVALLAVLDGRRLVRAPGACGPGRLLRAGYRSGVAQDLSAQRLQLPLLGHPGAA
jgi:hypothetical protein